MRNGLEALLDLMGYERDGSDGAYRHHDRRAIFVGDLIDRGPDQLRVCRPSRRWSTPAAPDGAGQPRVQRVGLCDGVARGSGKYLRPHDDPGNETAAKNEQQHAEFLEQVTGADRERPKWFWTQPLWLDLGGCGWCTRCWHADRSPTSKASSTGTRFTDLDQLVRASNRTIRSTPRSRNLLKGPEISLVDHGQEPYIDKDGHTRKRARLRWWHDGIATLRHPRGDGRKVPHPAGTRTRLPDIEVSGRPPAAPLHRAGTGHLRPLLASGHAGSQHDWTDYTACVDFSAVKEAHDGVPLVRRVRASGPEHYVSVPAQVGWRWSRVAEIGWARLRELASWASGRPTSRISRPPPPQQGARCRAGSGNVRRSLPPTRAIQADG